MHSEYLNIQKYAIIAPKKMTHKNDKVKSIINDGQKLTTDIKNKCFSKVSPNAIELAQSKILSIDLNPTVTNCVCIKGKFEQNTVYLYKVYKFI